MISQTDTALVSQADPSTRHEHHKQHLNSKNSSNAHSQTSNSKKHNLNANSDNEISANKIDDVTSLHIDKAITKKRRKLFDETIVDGFAIIAFKSWDDLQNELNERLEDSVNSDSNNNNINSTTLDVGKGSKNVGNNTASDRTNKHSKHHNGINSEHNHSSSASDSKSLTQLKESDGKKEKSKSSSRNVPGALKEKRGKPSSKPTDLASKAAATTSSEQSISSATARSTTLEQAIEAKELAEKRLSILERKLEQEQTRNRHPVSTDQYPRETVDNNNQPRTKVELSPDDRINGFANRDIPQPPQSPYLFSQRQTKHPMRLPYPMQSPPSPPQSKPLNQVHDPNQPPYHLHSQAGIGQSNPMAYPYSQTLQQPNAYPLHSQPQPASPFHQTYPHMPRYPSQGIPSSTPLLAQSQSNTQSQHPPSHLTHPYQLPIYPNGPHVPSPGHLMSPMGLGSLPTPYATPSICITDTISRQTSIIPPMFDPVSSRYGSGPSSLHPTSNYPQSALAPPHHSMYYPTLPTERSFLEFARSYSGPSQFGYPSIMSSQNTSANMNMGSASLDRWPRAALDHQRAISRYNNLYQSTTVLPSRAPLSNYSSVRPPFPAGLFVSIDEKKLEFI